MSHAGSHLPGANHWQFDIDVDRRVCHEPATEFPIELRGNKVGQGPAKNGQVQIRRCQQRRGGRGGVIAMTGHTARVEGQQAVGTCTCPSINFADQAAATY